MFEQTVDDCHLLREFKPSAWKKLFFPRRFKEALKSSMDNYFLISESIFRICWAYHTSMEGRLWIFRSLRWFKDTPIYQLYLNLVDNQKISDFHDLKNTMLQFKYIYERKNFLSEENFDVMLNIIQALDPYFLERIGFYGRAKLIDYCNQILPEQCAQVLAFLPKQESLFEKLLKDDKLTHLDGFAEYGHLFTNGRFFPQHNERQTPGDSLPQVSYRRWKFSDLVKIEEWSESRLSLEKILFLLNPSFSRLEKRHIDIYTKHSLLHILLTHLLERPFAKASEAEEFIERGCEVCCHINSVKEYDLCVLIKKLINTKFFHHKSRWNALFDYIMENGNIGFLMMAAGGGRDRLPLANTPYSPAVISWLLHASREFRPTIVALNNGLFLKLAKHYHRNNEPLAITTDLLDNRLEYCCFDSSSSLFRELSGILEKLEDSLFQPLVNRPGFYSSGGCWPISIAKTILKIKRFFEDVVVTDYYGTSICLEKALQLFNTIMCCRNYHDYLTTAPDRRIDWDELLVNLNVTVKAVSITPKDNEAIKRMRDSLFDAILKSAAPDMICKLIKAYKESVIKNRGITITTFLQNLCMIANAENPDRMFYVLEHLDFVEILKKLEKSPNIVDASYQIHSLIYQTQCLMQEMASEETDYLLLSGEIERLYQPVIERLRVRCDKQFNILALTLKTSAIRAQKYISCFDLETQTFYELLQEDEQLQPFIASTALLEELIYEKIELDMLGMTRLFLIDNISEPELIHEVASEFLSCSTNFKDIDIELFEQAQLLAVLLLLFGCNANMSDNMYKNMLSTLKSEEENPLLCLLQHITFEIVTNSSGFDFTVEKIEKEPYKTQFCEFIAKLENLIVHVQQMERLAYVGGNVLFFGNHGPVIEEIDCGFSLQSETVMSLSNLP